MNLLSENDLGAWIQILPLEKIDQESFSKVYVLLNKQKFLPDRLILWAPNGKDTQDYKFKTIKMNSNIDVTNFEGKIPATGWDVVRNPAGTQPAPGGNNQAVPRVGRLTPGSNNGGQAVNGGARSTSPSATAPGGTIRK